MDEIKENKKNSNDSLQEQQLVVFKVSDEEFGVNINEVKEIIRWEDVTKIPNTSPFIKGVINLRGDIIVVNDLAMKLGLPSKKEDDETRIIVVEIDKNNTVGMIVDSATEVMRLSGDKIKPAPKMINGNINSNYIQGVGLIDEKRLLTLLDLVKVLEKNDFIDIMKTIDLAKNSITDKKTNETKETEKKKTKNKNKKTNNQIKNKKSKGKNLKVSKKKK